MKGLKKYRLRRPCSYPLTVKVNDKSTRKLLSYFRQIMVGLYFGFIITGLEPVFRKLINSSEILIGKLLQKLDFNFIGFGLSAIENLNYKSPFDGLYSTVGFKGNHYIGYHRLFTNKAAVGGGRLGKCFVADCQ